MLPFGNISKRIFTHTASYYASKHTIISAIWQGRKCRLRAADLVVRAGAEGNAARCALAFFSKERGTLPPTLSWGRETKGVFSFAKENTPFGTPRERPDRQPRSRRSAAPPECSFPARGVAAFHIAIRLDLLLLPAAALPILQKYSLIPVYRWCQSRRRAKQSRRPQAVRRQTTVTRALRSARG